MANDVSLPESPPVTPNLKKGKTSQPSRVVHRNKNTGRQTTTTRRVNEEGVRETVVEREGPQSGGLSFPGGAFDTTILIFGFALVMLHLLTSQQGKNIWNAILAINKQAPRIPASGAESGGSTGEATTNVTGGVSGGSATPSPNNPNNNTHGALP